MTLPLTVFDLVDVAFIATICVLWLARGRAVLGWAVGGLIMYHAVARGLITTADHPLLALSMAQTAVAVGYLLSPILTNYGRMVGTLFCIMSMLSAAAVIVGHEPPIKAGLAWNVWNLNNALLMLAQAVIAVGIVRHGTLVSSRRLHH